MTLPFFYVTSLSDKKIILDEDTSRHVISVLRMDSGEDIMLTDGLGVRALARITDPNRKKCGVEIQSLERKEERKRKVSIAISLVKNVSRFEWFLEKAAELGVEEIIPLRCERTEKERFRYDRMKAILVSAMLQSQQCRMPLLLEPQDFRPFVASRTDGQRMIAHCLPEEKTELTSLQLQENALMLIGPEGDFTGEEIELAMQKGFVPVALGETRLRTETAGMVAAVLMVLNE
jgi:16S rRNA (uracil1498-N3)-methyltransferase